MIFILSFVVSILAFYIIRKSRLVSFFTQPQREITINASLKSQKRPIPCGGIIFFIIFSTVSVIKGEINYQYLTFFAFFLIGLIDDIGKITKKSHISFINARGRLILEVIFSGIFAYFFTRNGYALSYKEYSLDIPLFLAFPIVVFIIIGTANAVNLTDGQDGLVGKITLVHLFFLLALFNYHDSYITVIAVILGFLLFNSKPATIYMGDAGSLFLGSFLAISFLNEKIEYLLPLTGVVFVIEALSVILQVTYFKRTKNKYGEGKRIFKMAPLHHHLEMCNISEEKITNLAFITTIITCYTAYCLIK